MARVAALRTRELSLPLHTPFVTALRRTTTVETLLVVVECDDGQVGLGEAPQVWQVTGESVVGARACVQTMLAPIVLGSDPDDWADTAARLGRACARNFGAKAAVETALLDLAARRAGRTLAGLLAEHAGRPRPSAGDIATDVTVSAGSASELAEAARVRVAAGFDRLKLKVGTDAATEVARVRAVREAVGACVGIRLDANQGWSRDEAVEVIRALGDADLGVELVEQPVAGEDVEGMAWVRERVPLAVMADETVYGERDLDRVIRLGAADGVNVKLAKCAGPLTGLRLLHTAREAGLATMVGSMMESQVGIAAAGALVLAAGGTTAVPDLDAAWWLQESPYAGGPAYRGGRLWLGDAPGLGINASG